MLKVLPRTLRVHSLRCRVAQEVIRALIEPIFAPTFHDSSHGFRRRRSCHTAMAQLVELHQQGYRVVVDADLKGFFDSIPHHLILDLVAGEIADGNILSLITKFLQAGVMEEGELRPTWQGTPQGGVLSAPCGRAHVRRGLRPPLQERRDASTPVCPGCPVTTILGKTLDRRNYFVWSKPNNRLNGD
jgi:hypothetical protein